MQKLESKLVSEVKIQNTVTTADLKQEIDIGSFNEYENLSSNNITDKGIDYIVTHLNEKITLDDVASHCHFSKFYFSRFFKAEC